MSSPGKIETIPAALTSSWEKEEFVGRMASTYFPEIINEKIGEGTYTPGDAASKIPTR